MEEQMKFAFMQRGGVLKDDGMNRDPVSGNEVPSGSMAKEVRDDIDAKLSEGEYVVPADVVRFHGVQKFEELRNQAKQGFGRMEKDGRIGGQPVDDDFPIPMDQLQTFDEGGDTSTYEQTFGQPFTMGQRYGSMGAPQNRGYELITYTSPDGKRTIVIPHFNGKPMSAVPTGFTEQGGAGDTVGSGVGMTDDSEESESKPSFLQSSLPAPIDPMMQAQLDKDARLTQPKAIENFTGKDYADYYNQTQGFGIDDIARNVPLLGGLMSMQDDNIRKAALKGLQDGTLDIGSEDEFNAIKSLVTTAPQQSFLSKLFGATEDFTPPTGLPTFADYQKQSKQKQAVTDISLEMQSEYEKAAGIGATPTADTRASLDKVPDNTILSPANVTNIIRDMGKSMPFKGTLSENISEAMLGIRERDGKAVVSTPKTEQNPTGEKQVDAKTMKSIVKNAEEIQQRTEDAYKNPNLSFRERERIIHGFDVYAEPSVSRGSAGQDNIGGVSSPAPDITQPIMADKGALVTKPKRKVAPKKRTPRKGLGNKTKAT
jgi:hypothetical protein